MKVDKTRIGVSLCCAAALFGTVAYAVSPAFAADTSGGGISGTLLSSAPYTDTSEEQIKSGGEYVSLEDDPGKAAETFSIPSDSKVGDQYISGDMIIEIVMKDEVERACADDGGTSGTVLSTASYADASEEENDESGRMARIKIKSGGEYVSLEDDPGKAAETFSIPSDGKVGEQYISGDMIIEIVTKDEVERACAD